MHDFSPLSPLDLRAIEDSLNAGDLEKAQQQLADLASHADLEPGATYLATRLLFLRGRLDAAGVVDRMRELVGAHPTFAEAREFMDHCRTALRTDGSVPPPGDTPRPRTLFPSAPPEASAPTTTLSAPPATAWSAPPAKPTQELKQGERSGPWSVPEVEETDLLDSDRPTVEPELGQSDQDGASLAPTEFPSALPSSLPSVSPDNLDRNSREIRVDTRQSYLPSPDGPRKEPVDEASF